MTKQQIKESLLICSKKHPLNYCCKCSYYKSVDCIYDLLQDAANAIEPECAVFDKVEEHENCTVQILHNTKTGAISVGWRKND